MSQNKEETGPDVIKNRNVGICVNDTNKNGGAFCADKNDIITECRRQLYDVVTYNNYILKFFGNKQ